MRIILMLLATAALMGCEPSHQTDQCMRAELFHKCLTLVPKGPETTKYNDWDEVVDSCANTAHYHSVRKSEFIPKQCK